jgi:hypothetical protein
MQNDVIGHVTIPAEMRDDAQRRPMRLICLIAFGNFMPPGAKSAVAVLSS